MDDFPYTPEQITVLSSVEAVRKRPGMHIGDVDLFGMTHYLAGAVNLLLAMRPTRLNFAVEDGGYVVAADVALAVARMTDGRADCFEEPWTHNDGTVLNAFAERLTVEIHRAGEAENLAFRRGVREVWTKQPDAASAGVETTLKFTPDVSIFTLAEISPAIFQSYLRRLSFLHPGVRFSFADRSETHEYHAQRGIVDLFDAMSAAYILLHEPIHFTAEEEGLTIEAVFAHHAWSRHALRCFINGGRAVEGGSHEQGIRDALTQIHHDYAPPTPEWSKPNGVVGVASIQYSGDLHWCGAVREKIDDPKLRERVRSLFVRGASERLHERPDVVESLKPLRRSNALEFWYS